MERALGLLLLCMLALTPSPARALCVHTTYRLVAFSSDGESVLLEVIGHGPEGGGGIDYLIHGVAAPTTTRFRISSDYSPGDGSTPQSVSDEALKKTLRELTEAVKKRKLAGVQVTFAGGRRSDLVTAGPRAEQGTELKPIRGELAGGGLRIALRARALVISDGSGSQTLELWAPLESLKGVTARTARGKLLVLMRDGGRCARSIAVLFAASGKARDLRMLAPR